MKTIILAVSLALSTLTLPVFAAPKTYDLGVNRTVYQFRYDATPASSTALGHGSMTTLTNEKTNQAVYTQDDVNKLQAEAYAYFRKVVGVDFSTAPIINGLRTILDSANNPVAVLVPLSVGTDNKYRVLYDSDFSRYKNDGFWIVKNFSYIMQYLTIGTVSSTPAPGSNIAPTAAGQNFAPFDVMSYGYTVQLKEGTDWSQNPNREFYTVATTGPQKQPANAFGGLIPGPANAPGKLDQHVGLQYINERTQAVGFGSDDVYNNQPGNTIGSRMVKHSIIFLTNPTNDPILPDMPAGSKPVGAAPIGANLNN